MKTYRHKMFYLVAILALLVGLEFSPSPAAAAPLACDPHLVKRSGTVFTVLPSGDPTGVADAANLACAFESAKSVGPGSTVKLVSGSYRTGMVDVAGFDGFFVGAGMGNTVILPAHHMDCTGQTDRNNIISLITFRLGNPRVSDMTMTIDDPEPCAWYLSGPDWYRYSLESILLFTGSEIGSVDPCHQLKYEKGKGSVNRVELKIPPIDAPNSNLYVIRSLYITSEFVLPWNGPGCEWWQSQLAGEYTVTNSVFSSYIAGVTSEVYDGKVTIHGNTFNNPSNGIASWDTQGTLVTVQDNTFNNPANEAIDAYGNFIEPWDTQPSATIPVSYWIDHNSITVNNTATGINLLDWANVNYGENRTKGLISNNHVTLNGTGAWGIIVEGVKDSIVINNKIDGKGDAGIVMDFGNFWGLPATALENCKVAANNISQFAFFDANPHLSPIYLGPATHRCTVIGANLTDTVLDEGTDNRLIGIKPLSWNGQGDRIHKWLDWIRKGRGMH